MKLLKEENLARKAFWTGSEKQVGRNIHSSIILTP